MHLEMANNSTNSYRYERKFIAPTEHLIELENIVRGLPGFFTLLHPPRRINNLYFDSPSLEDFMFTCNGEKKRQKVRLRWYGETYTTEPGAPQLEIKIKSDQANTKEIAILDGGDSTQLSNWVSQLPDNDSVTGYILESLSMRRPTLLNSYYRHYFGSADGKYRLTLDLGITYQSVSPAGEPIGNSIKEENRSIIELKYDVDDQQAVPRITAALPYRLSRNSKYRNGIVQLMEQGYI